MMERVLNLWWWYMSNYGVQIGNLSTQEMPCLFLSAIFDINLVSAKNGYKSISSVEMYSKLNKFIDDNQRGLVFLTFNGSQYIDKNYGIEVQDMDFALEARSGIDKFLQFKGSPFFNFKLYFYHPLKTMVETGYGISIRNSNSEIIYIQGSNGELSYAEDFKIGDVGNNRLYLSSSYALEGNIRKFYASNSQGGLVIAEMATGNTELAHYQLNPPILSIKMPSSSDEETVRKRGTYITIR